MHAKAAAFLLGTADGSEVFCIAWVEGDELPANGHASVDLCPTPVAGRSAGHVQALLNVAYCRALGEDAGFWAFYRQVTQGLVAHGNLVPDAHLAAVLRLHGVVKLYTHDRDFRKFGFLQVIDPLA